MINRTSSIYKSQGEVPTIRFFLLGFSISFTLFFILTYKEHLMGDNVVFLFNVIQKKSFWAPHHRFSLFIHELPWLLAAKLGMDLKGIFIINCLSYCLYYQVLFLILLYFFKDIKAALCLGLLLTIGNEDLYYHTITSLKIGLITCVLLFSYLKNYDEIKAIPRTFKLIVLLLLCILVILYHPLAPLFVIFVSLYSFIHVRKIRIPEIAAFFGGLFGVIYQYITMSRYERNKVQLDINPFDYFRDSEFMSYIFKHYFIVLIALIILVFLLIKQKNFIKLSFILLAFFILLFLIYGNFKMIIRADCIVNLEKYHYGLLFLVFLPFCIEIGRSPSYIPKKVLYGLVCLFIIFGFLSIIDNYEKYRERQNFMMRIIASPNTDHTDRLIISGRNVPVEFKIFAWTYSYESFLLSASNPYTPTKSIIFAEDKYKRHKIPESRMESDFFRIPAGNYKVINNFPKKDSINQTYLKKIDLEFVHFRRLYQSGDLIKPSILIRNHNELPIPSGIRRKEEDILITYQWYTENGEALKAKSLLTPLELDIFNRHVQRISVICPKEPGNFTLELGLFYKKKYWAVSTSRVTIRIKP